MFYFNLLETASDRSSGLLLDGNVSDRTQISVPFILFSLWFLRDHWRTAGTYAGGTGVLLGVQSPDPLLGVPDITQTT